MYAHCPRCETVFAISAAHLRAAHGYVRCGRCSDVFDALAYLTDAPDEQPPEPESGPTPPQAPLSKSAGHGRSESWPGAGGEAYHETDGGHVDTVGAPGDARRRLDHDAVPAALVEDLARDPRALARAPARPTMPALAALLLLALVAQYAWFDPDDLVARSTKARAWG